MRIPFLDWRPVDGLENDPPIKPIGVVLHVAVSEASSLEGWWNNPASGGLESHTYVRRDGTGEQYRDTEREADAQAAGNSFTVDGVRCGFISVETQGMGDGEWTPEQLATIKRILLWAHREHGVPLKVCEGAFSPGVGFHAMFHAWNPNEHTCPGSARIRQFNRVLVPWMSDPTLEDDVTVDELLTAKIKISDTEELSLRQILKYTLINARKIQTLEDDVAAVKDDLADVKTVVGLGSAGLKLSYLLTPVEPDQA